MPIPVTGNRYSKVFQVINILSHAMDSLQSLAIELAGANSGDWSHGSNPATPPKICHQPRTLLEERTKGKKSLDHFAQKSLVLLRLPARQAKVYLLKTAFFLLPLSSVLHPPFAVSTSHGTFFLIQQYPSVRSHLHHLHIATRAIAFSGLLPAKAFARSIIHTYIQSDDCCYFASAPVVGTHSLARGQHPSRLPADLYTVAPRGHRGLIKESISKVGLT